MTDQLPRLTAALADRYRIERELGAGGMATVYLAHDLRHNRKVALKLLRPELAAMIGAERFLKEIETTANLQHPHILPLHDSGEADGFLYYVMPFVEGDTLRDRLNREKQLRVTDAVELIRGVAAALDYAHRQGVIHRDIKPENVLLHDGQAMVADFGIALAVRQAGGARLTETGLSIGTPSYMSPEQAMGDRELDARSDIYSLGAMLYEMLAGEPPFTGGNAQAIVARILTETPPLVTKARASVPPHVAAAIHQSLSRLPADRFPTAADFASALTNPGFTLAGVSSGATAKPASLWNPVSVGTSAVALVALAVAAWALFRPAVLPVTRVAVAFNPGEEPGYGGALTPGRLAVSPDGSSLVYLGDRPDNRVYQLFLRRLDQLEGRPLPGTEDAGWPAISPDGERVAFIAEETTWRLKVASLSGGPPITVVDSGITSPAAWGPDDMLYFFDSSGLTLRRVPANGGPIEDVVTVKSPMADGMFTSPQVLPGGRAVLATMVPPQESAREFALYAIDLESGAARLLMGGVAQGWYLVTGHLLYVTTDEAGFTGTLMAVPFDPDALELTGRPVALVEGLDLRARGTVDLSVSTEGTLVYGTGGAPATEDLVWVSRAGLVEKVDPGWTGYHEFEGMALSPDGSQVAVEAQNDARTDIWIKQLDRGPLSRLTFDGFSNAEPAWSPDGMSVGFQVTTDSGAPIWRRRADGSGPPEPMLRSPRAMSVSWSPDGRWLLGLAVSSTGADIYALQVGVDSQPQPLLADRFNETTPALSPDGRWIAYASDESGRLEIYVRPFPDVQGGRWQLSTNGGTEPLWNPAGRELFFRSADGQSIEVVDLSGGPAKPVPGPPTAPDRSAGGFEINPNERLYDVTRDGRRFLMIQQAGLGDASGAIVLVRNWFQELKAAAKP